MDLFTVIPSLPIVKFSGRSEQWVIDTHKEEEELENLRYFRQRYFDFLEWYEINYSHTEKELWEKDRYPDAYKYIRVGGYHMGFYGINTIKTKGIEMFNKIFGEGWKYKVDEGC